MHNVSIVISRKHKSSPSHIRCQLIDLIQIIRNYLRAYTGIAQISFNEFVRPGISKFVLFYVNAGHPITFRSEEHTSELQSLMRISYAVFCLKKKKKNTQIYYTYIHYITTQLNTTMQTIQQ